MSTFSDTPRRMRDMYASRSEPEGLRRLADFYWRGLLVVAAAVVLCALAYGIFDLLNALDNLVATPDTSPLPPASLNRAALDAVVQGFQARQAQFEALGGTLPAALPASGTPGN